MFLALIQECIAKRWEQNIDEETMMVCFKSLYVIEGFSPEFRDHSRKGSLIPEPVSNLEPLQGIFGTV